MWGKEDRVGAIIEALRQMSEDPHSKSKSPWQKFYEALAMTDTTLPDLPEWRDLSPAQQASIESFVTTWLQQGREDQEDQEDD